MKRFLLILLAAPAALGAVYNVELPGGGVLTVNGLPYINPGITNSASVVWGADGTGLLYATATGTNSSIIYVEGSAVAGPNFGLSTEIDPVVTASTNITFSLVNGSITTNKIDTTFYGLLMAAGSGDVTQAGNNTFTGTNIFQSSTTISNLVSDTVSAVSLTLDTPIGVTAVGTNAADARVQLGVAYDVNVQAYRLGLLQAALALTADGHMVYHNGTLVTNLLSTSAGRYLLTATTAADQRNALVVGELSQDAYGAGWDGATGKTATLDALYDKIQSLPGGSNNISSWNPTYFSVAGGYLDWVGGSVGGGSGGYTYLATNVGGAWQSRTGGTNWTILSTTVSSNYAPASIGRFLEGGWSTVISNYSGTSANVYLTINANGTDVFKDAVSLNNTMRGQNSTFWLVRETDTTAAIITLGSQGGPAAIGQGDFGGTVGGAVTISTNVAWNWATNNTLQIALQCETSTSTNDALGMRMAWSYLRAENAASSGSGDVVGPASSTTNNIAIFTAATGKLIADGGVAIAELATVADPVFTGTATFDTINTSTLTVTNPFPARGITNATASRFAVWGADYRLTNDVAETGTGAPVRANSPALITPTLGVASATSVAIGATNVVSELALKAPLASPTLASPTLNDTVTFEQTVLAAHSSVTNFVADPTVSPYQTINADLTTAFTGVRFLHATNVAAGRQTTVLVFAGTNAAVSVALNSQFAYNTNLVALTTGQVLPVSFYGYGSSPTNVIATLGTIYTR